MELQEIIKMLSKNGVKTWIGYDISNDQFFIDLNTQAKSPLYLYEDGMLYGRYGHREQLNLDKEPEELLKDLCHKFNGSLYGRNYYQEGWADLCFSKGMFLNIDYIT